MGKVGAWLGMTANGTETGVTGKVPMWHGVRTALKLTWSAVWAAVAAVVFLLANQRMPEDDGFGGFIPLYFAVTVFIAGIAVTERNAVRVAKPMENTAKTDFIEPAG